MSETASGDLGSSLRDEEAPKSECVSGVEKGHP